MVKEKGCNGFLKRIDMYGIPVSLTYRKSPEIKTSLGGMLTIISRLLIVVFLGLQIKDVIKRKYTI